MPPFVGYLFKFSFVVPFCLCCNCIKTGSSRGFSALAFIFVKFSQSVVVVDPFYIALLSALEHTDCVCVFRRCPQAAVKKLLATPQAKVVVLFTEGRRTNLILCAVARMGLFGKYTFVGSDAVYWNAQLCPGIERVVDGMLKISFSLSPVERFEQRFRHMTLRTGSRNPWFAEFFSRLFDCKTTLQSGPGSCDLDKEMMEAKAYRPSTLAVLAINAVYAYAYALHAIVKNCKLADVKQCVKPKLLLDTLRTVRFSAEGFNISFDKTGNGQINYLILNYVLENGTLLPKKVGEWDITRRNFSFFDKVGVFLRLHFLLCSLSVSVSLSNLIFLSVSLSLCLSLCLCLSVSLSVSLCLSLSLCLCLCLSLSLSLSIKVHRRH